MTAWYKPTKWEAMGSSQTCLQHSNRNDLNTRKTAVRVVYKKAAGVRHHTRGNNITNNRHRLNDRVRQWLIELPTCMAICQKQQTCHRSTAEIWHVRNCFLVGGPHKDTSAPTHARACTYRRCIGEPWSSHMVNGDGYPG